MSQKAVFRVPWTELFRPKTFDEVILTRKQRAQILNWWRAWIVLWNAIEIWNRKHRNPWFEYLRTPEGKKFAGKYLSSWKKFFSQKFEAWVGGSSEKTPAGQEALFKKASPRSAKLTTDLKPTALAEIERWMNRVWGEFLSKKNVDATPPAIPPLPPYKPILLVGPPGTGKTSSIHALANQEGIIVVEFNASDKRSGSVIRDVVKEALKSAGFSLGGATKPPRIILLDEVDGLSARDDRGGLSALLRLLEEVRLPVAFTANVMHDRKVKRLMLVSVTVFFDRPYEYQIVELIKRISRRVKREFPPEVVNRLKYAPDFRTVVEALETYYYTGVLPSIYHEQEYNIYDAIRFAFGIKSDSDVERTAQRVSRILSSVPDFEPWDIILWVWENAYKFLDTSKGLFGFYKMLADADYLYKVGARTFNWRIAYRDAMQVLSWALAEYGRKAKSPWELRRIKVVKPTIVEKLGELKRLMEGEVETVKTETEGEEGEAEEATVEPKRMGLRPLLEAYAKNTHISRKRARLELKFLLHIVRQRPEEAGRLFALWNVPKDTIEILLQHFFAKGERTQLSKKIFEAYEDALARLGPKVVEAIPGIQKEVPAEAKEVVSEKAKKEAKPEEKPAEEKAQRRKRAKKAKKQPEEKGPTLDMFFG